MHVAFTRLTIEYKIYYVEKKRDEDKGTKYKSFVELYLSHDLLRKIAEKRITIFGDLEKLDTLKGRLMSERLIE